MLNLTTIVDAVRDLTAALKEVAHELRESRSAFTKKQLQFPVIPKAPDTGNHPSGRW